jgi:hypothetical protein
VKFDALRIQLYTHGQWIAIYTRSGADFVRRLLTIAAALSDLQTRLVIIDGGLVAYNEQGFLDFCYCTFIANTPRSGCEPSIFGTSTAPDLRVMPLSIHKYALEKLLAKAQSDLIRYSGALDDGESLIPPPPLCASRCQACSNTLIELTKTPVRSRLWE